MLAKLKAAGLSDKSIRNYVRTLSARGRSCDVVASELDRRFKASPASMTRISCLQTR